MILKNIGYMKKVFKFPRNFKKHEGEFITYDDNIVHVEGDKPMEGRVILFCFPSAKHADEWYSDPEYQALSEHRRCGTTSTITRISGLLPR